MCQILLKEQMYSRNETEALLSQKEIFIMQIKNKSMVVKTPRKKKQNMVMKSGVVCVR